MWAYLSRRLPEITDPLEPVLAELEKLRRGDVLGFVVPHIEALVHGYRTALDSGSASTRDVRRVAASLKSFLDALPDTTRERFPFDAAYVHSLSAEYENSLLLAKTVVLPCYGQWGHSRFALAPGAALDLIFIPGGSSLRDIDLLRYPMIHHEGGHVIWASDPDFLAPFRLEIEERARHLRLQGLSDREAQRERNARKVELFEKAWTPRTGRDCWAQELGMDLVGLWTCGPAFLDAFVDEVESLDEDPYYINTEHPPYEVRAFALLNAADVLGWGSYTGRLEGLLGDWQSSRHAVGRTNDYLALTPKPVVEACVQKVLVRLEHLQLRKCTEESLIRAEQMIESSNYRFGPELLLAAWLMQRRIGSKHYPDWERSTVSELSKQVTLGSQ